MYKKASDNTLEAARGILRKLAEPAVPGESVKALLLRISRKLPTLSSGRVRSIWYRDQRLKISAEELIELKRAAKIDDEARDASDDVSALRKRLELLEIKIEALVSKDAAQDRLENS
jgi:hypothetical protein